MLVGHKLEKYLSMKKELLDSLPYHSIEELIKLREYFTQIESDNINEITRKESTDDSVLCEFVDNISNYTFVVRDFKYTPAGGKNTYTLYRRPESKLNMNGISLTVSIESIKKNFAAWITVCQEMNKIKFTFLNPGTDFYENEFFEYFSNNDEDASRNPFDIDRQEVLFYFLTYAEKRIAEASNITDDERILLLSEVSELKSDIPKDTKKIIVYRLSQLAQRTKKISNKLFHDVFDVLKKELIKKVLYEGAAQITNTVTKIEHWITLLNN